MPPRDTLSHLRAGWRPGSRDIAEADVIEGWKLTCRGHGLYMLQGTVDGQPSLAGLIAIDPRNSWALVQDRLLALGERAPEACIAVVPDEVVRRAAALFEAAPSELGSRALDLAREAERAGLDTAAYLLDMAAHEIEQAIRLKHGIERA